MSNNGTASVLAQGGAGAYTYTWYATPIVAGATALSNTSSVSALTAGTYKIVVIDDNGTGCLQELPFVISEPAQLVSNLISNDVSCFGLFNGNININTLGGTPPYTYQWNGPAGYLSSLQNITNLGAGSYQVDIIDINSCSTTNSIIITEPPVLDGVSNTIDPSCHNYTDGSISLLASGGVSPYYATYGGGNPSYQASTTPVDSIVFDGLGSGNLPLVLMDDNGCILNVTVSPLLNPLELLIPSVSVEDPLCHGDSGTVSINAIGGTLDYSFAISDANGNSVINSLSSSINLLAGNYNCLLTDANNCLTFTNFSISQPAEIAINTLSIVDVKCFGESSGSIGVDIQNAVGNYSVFWSPSGIQSETANNLSAGTHIVEVLDGNSCYNTSTYTLTQPSDIVVDMYKTDALCANSFDGEIDIYSISGGVALYDVYIDDVLKAEATDNTVIKKISSGTYLLKIVDNIGCIDTMTVAIGVTGSDNCVSPSVIVTPDGSFGTNDSWSPALDLSGEQIEVTILNRWGFEVWNCFSNGLDDCEWRGQNNNGDPLPSTDYYYIIDFTNKNNTKPAKTGVITLIR